MKKLWHEKAWDDYLYWESQDRKIIKRINKLIQSIERNICGSSQDGSIGKPEYLKFNESGLISARIDHKNRLIYKVENNDTLYIVSCRGHYDS